MNALLPILAAVAFLAFAAFFAIGRRQSTGIPWPLPAVLAGMFLAFSFYAVATEGPFGFWAEHTRNFWSNQIWLDLLLAVGVGWVLIVPRARSLGMHPLPWLIAVALTGSIGFLAMLSRLLYLQTLKGEPHR